MRALTVRQPWAWAIIHGQKDVENRSCSLGPYRGEVAVHAGLTVDLAAASDLTFAKAWHEAYMPERNDGRNIGWGNVPDLSDLVDDDDADLPRGTIIGVVDLVGVHLDVWTPDGCRTLESGMCSRWAMPGHHHLVLANPRPLPEHIPWRGALGLWTVPADLEAAIHAEIDGSGR